MKVCGCLYTSFSPANFLFKCDETRPACRPCITRDEACVGYRDESDLVFRHETQKVVAKATALAQHISSPEQSESSHTSSLPSGSLALVRSVSLDSIDIRGTTGISPFMNAPERSAYQQLNVGSHDFLQDQDQAVSNFFEKYVMYPGKNSQSGFLEHLPCLFGEVNVDGRYALRWAVQAAALADASRDHQPQAGLATQALDCYGKALAALSQSLSEKGKIPDDYDLMTVVVLDVFEVLRPFSRHPASVLG